MNRLRKGIKPKEKPKEFPKLEGMIKADRKVCKKCKYRIFISDTEIYCWYYMTTNNHRGCPVGYCDKFERRKRSGSNTT